MTVPRWTSAILAGVLTGTAVCGIAALPTVAQPAGTIVAQRTTSITESQIRKILADMQTAATKQDVDGIMKYMAPTIAITMTIQTANGSETLTLTREQYRQYLQQGFEMIQGSRTKVSNLKVKVASNRKAATATYILTEETTLKDQPITVSAVTNQSVQFELVQGQILETSVKSTSKLNVQRR